MIAGALSSGELFSTLCQRRDIPAAQQNGNLQPFVGIRLTDGPRPRQWLALAALEWTSRGLLWSHGNLPDDFPLQSGHVNDPFWSAYEGDRESLWRWNFPAGAILDHIATPPTEQITERSAAVIRSKYARAIPARHAPCRGAPWHRGACQQASTRPLSARDRPRTGTTTSPIRQGRGNIYR